VTQLGLAIRHHTGFTYDGAARFSYNEARMTPVNGPTQDVRHSQVSVTPSTQMATYRDYFSTVVTTFDIQEPHERLEVEARSQVLSTAATLGEAVSWGQLADPDLADRLSDYLLMTRRTELPESATEAVKDFRDDLDLHECAEAVGEFVRSKLVYVPGATSVSFTASEAWASAKGVCQDITHVTIGLLRSLGVPTRYVSGYLYPENYADVGVDIDGQSHAWVEYFSGEWTGLDPTNGVRETERHIIVGRGRDYDDVAPLKGIYQGSPASNLGVVVAMSRTN
jgi:transglutaminase-like putative cysteine protease